jgi:hypothetical protein
MNGRGFNLDGADDRWLAKALELCRQNPDWLTVDRLRGWLLGIGIELDRLIENTDLTPTKLEEMLRFFKRKPALLQPVRLAAMLEVLGIRLRLSAKLYPYRWENPQLVQTVFRNSSPWGNAHQYNWLTIYSWEWIFSNTLIPNLKGVYERFPAFVENQRITNKKWGAENNNWAAVNMLRLTAQELWRNGVPPFWFAGYVNWGDDEATYGAAFGEFKSISFSEWQSGGFKVPYDAAPYLQESGLLQSVTPPISWVNGIVGMGRMTSRPVPAL